MFRYIPPANNAATKAMIFVSPQGDDGNDGLSPTTPIKTIGQAMFVGGNNAQIICGTGQYSVTGTDFFNTNSQGNPAIIGDGYVEIRHDGEHVGTANTVRFVALHNVIAYNMGYVRNADHCVLHNCQDVRGAIKNSLIIASYIQGFPTTVYKSTLVACLFGQPSVNTRFVDTIFYKCIEQYNYPNIMVNCFFMDTNHSEFTARINCLPSPKVTTWNSDAYGSFINGTYADNLDNTIANLEQYFKLSIYQLDFSYIDGTYSPVNPLLYAGSDGLHLGWGQVAKSINGNFEKSMDINNTNGSETSPVGLDGLGGNSDDAVSNPAGFGTFDIGGDGFISMLDPNATGNDFSTITTGIVRLGQNMTLKRPFLFALQDFSIGKRIDMTALDTLANDGRPNRLIYNMRSLTIEEVGNPNPTEDEIKQAMDAQTQWFQHEWNTVPRLDIANNGSGSENYDVSSGNDIKAGYIQIEYGFRNNINQSE